MREGIRHNNAYSELEKAKEHVLIETIEYVPNSVRSRTIIKRATGNITATSFDLGEEIPETISPFDTFIHVIEGAAEITISQITHTIQFGTGIVIPAHAPHRFHAREQFKMISMVIKSGYED